MHIYTTIYFKQTHYYFLVYNKTSTRKYIISQVDVIIYSIYEYTCYLQYATYAKVLMKAAAGQERHTVELALLNIYGWRDYWIKRKNRANLSFLIVGIIKVAIFIIASFLMLRDIFRILKINYQSVHLHKYNRNKSMCVLT